MIKLKYIYESILNERVSDTVYHATSIGNAYSIVDSDSFVLPYTSGTKSEKDKGSKIYYLSLARSMSSGYYYFRSPSSGTAYFKLNGDLLNRTYKGYPVDYWDGMHTKDVEYMTNMEMEDRVISDKPYIKPASKYIEEVYLFLGNEKFKRYFDSENKRFETKRWYELDNKIPDSLKIIIPKFLIALKKKNIPFYIYTSKSDLLSNNKKNAISFKDIDLKPKEYDGKYYRPPGYGIDGDILLIINLYYQNNPNKIYNNLKKIRSRLTLDHIKSKIYDMSLLHKNDYLLNEFIRSIESNLHNYKTKGGSKKYIRNILDIMEKEKTNDIKDIVVKVSKKWDKLLK